MFNIIFLDIDGVCTSMVETPGSYLNHDVSDYGLSPKCMSNLIQLIRDTNSKIIISSNWRIHGTKKHIIDHGNKLYNPIAMLIDEIGNDIIGLLPKTPVKHKAEALIQWFDENDFDGNFAILDDDLEEHIHEVDLYSIKNHFVYTNKKYGLTKDDCLKVKKILNVN